MITVLLNAAIVDILIVTGNLCLYNSVNAPDLALKAFSFNLGVVLNLPEMTLNTRTKNENVILVGRYNNVIKHLHNFPPQYVPCSLEGLSIGDASQEI